MFIYSDNLIKLVSKQGTDMCGIAGVIALKNEITESENQCIRQMVSSIIHRGPDNQGFYNNKNISLGNARLTIIDPSPKANLPIVINDGDYVLCYNGEITNFLELKEKYKLADKYDFICDSDSEVVLRLYQEIGIKLLDEISGMFSFCIYDKKKSKAYLCRDFYGINPQFYTIKDDKLYFCSEIKGLLEIEGFKKSVNKKALFDYLTLAYVPGEDTMFENILELRNGQMIEVDLQTGEWNKSYHYRMKYEINRDISFEAAKLKTRELLTDSVRRNMISDAPLGTTLSGGIDTSGITCLARDIDPNSEFHTFSIRMGEHSFDESHYQRLISEQRKTIHHEIDVSAKEVSENFINHIAHLDEPLGDGASIPFFILASKAKKYVKVLLSGEGGDEVFNAYSVYQAWKVRKYYVKYCPKFLRNIVFNLVHLLPSNYSKLSFDFQAKRFTEGAELHPAAAHIYWRHPFTNEEKDKMLKYKDFRSTDDLLINLFNEYSHTDELNRISMLDIEHFITDDLLLKNDRMLLAHSIEGRFPYLDRKLIDFAQTLPTDYKLKGLKGRYIQKKALEHTLPKEILARQNYGLEMPHSIWFFEGLKPFFEKYMNKEYIEKNGYFHWDSVKEMIDDHFNKKRDYGRGLWCILNFLVWHEMYIESDDYKNHYIRDN